MRQMFLVPALLAVAIAPALAEDRPLVRPSRDVTVEYRSSGTPQGPAAQTSHEVTMRFASKSGLIRIDGPNRRGYAILDINAGRMMVVMTERRMYMEQPAEPSMTAMFQAANTAFTRTGTDTVAGVACTTDDARINDRRGHVCLTDDGVLLRARSDDPDRRRELEAVTVTYGDQPAALFAPPAGFQKLDAAAMSRGMNMGPQNGQPGR